MARFPVGNKDSLAAGWLGLLAERGLLHHRMKAISERLDPLRTTTVLSVLVYLAGLETLQFPSRDQKREETSSLSLSRTLFKQRDIRRPLSISLSITNISQYLFSIILYSIIFQDDDHYDKREVPSSSKRAKTDSSPLSTTPDPYAAMALYYSKLNAFRPWSPKGGFPGLPPYPLHSPYSRGAASDQENSPVESPLSREKRKYQFDKGEP